MQRATRAAVGAGLVVLLAACEEQNAYVPPPPPTVGVAEPVVRDITEYLAATGTLVASARVEVPARVVGVLQAAHFEPGAMVAAGDLLFTIDPVEYEAAVQAAEAELASAEARQTEARRALDRAEELIQRGNISQAAVDEARAAFLTAQAEVLVRQANLTRARIDLGYTRVVAPIAGRVGRALIDPGNLVGAGQATVLSDITAFDPIHVYFDVNEGELLRLMDRARAAGRGTEVDGIPVEVGLGDDADYPHLGFVDFADSSVNASSGTLRLRGVLANPEVPPVLLPGMFARVRMPVGARPGAVLVRESAIGFDQAGRYVLSVGDDGTVAKRLVEVGALVDGLRVIENGLDPGERIVVRGLQRARDGIVVNAQDAAMAARPDAG